MVDYFVQQESDNKQQPSRRKSVKFIIFLLLLIIISVVVGFLAGFFAKSPKTCEANSSPPDAWIDYEMFHQKFLDLVSSQELESNLRYFSEQPHIAGSPRQKELALELANRWKRYGFDKVELPRYQVLLSFPREDKPNKVSVVWQNGTVDYEIIGKQQVHGSPNSDKTFVYTSYHAYSPNGTVTGDLVYANRGSDQDFKRLKKMNVTVEGKIVLIRSRNIRGPEKHGAKGVITFPDPMFGGKFFNDTYPDGQWLPPENVREGAIYSGGHGDPLTPGIPSIDGMHRLPYNESRMPSIPAQPISYGDALKLLRRLAGEVAPEEMRGNNDFIFRVGPGFKKNGTRVRLEVNNYLQQKTIYNVIGTIRGNVEPDRILLVGNHRDAWLFGAVDASSGTSVTNEIARGLGILLKQGWRPRRTVKVCSWGGEEFNLIGSTEWVEQNQKILTERGVAYINLDIAVGGNYVMRARTSPLFKEVTYSWAQKIKDPNAHDDKVTTYDVWLERSLFSDDLDNGKPKIYNLFAGSDYAFFYNFIGLPCGDYGYWFGLENSSYLYPVYHSQADTFYWMKNFVDPEFAFHKLMTQFGGGMLLDFVDSPILPLSVPYFAHALNTSFHILKSSGKFQQHGISLDPLEKAVITFINTSVVFERFKSSLSGKENFSVLRQVNDQMSQLEKAFINPYGLPGKPFSRHVAFSFGDFHNLEPGVASFPGITEALYRASRSGNWGEVERQISIAASAVLSGAQILELY